MRALALFLLASFAAATASAWGCEGHQLIALMARRQLKPAVSAVVNKILADGPISPALSRFCKDRPADPMGDVATWADDVRSQAGNGEWHFVDIPGTLTKTPADHGVLQWCGNPANANSLCITAALEAQLAILKDPSKSAADRGTALRYVIHLVEDLHQPLHDTDNNDKGGNCTVLKFLSEDRPTNLHTIWDTKLIAHDMKVKKLDQAGYVAALSAEFARHGKSWRKQKFNPTLWAWDGHHLANKLAYGQLSPQIPVETPGVTDCDAERAKVQALHIAINEDYFNRAIPEVREQLAKSAARLASLLNRSL